IGEGMPAACAYGLAMEKPACELYLREKNESYEYYCLEKGKMGPAFTAEPGGLVVMRSHPWLAATPDFVITCYDRSKNLERFLVEVKAYTPKDFAHNHEELAYTYDDFCCQTKDGKLEIRKDHRFYYQIIGQLNVTGLNRCDLVIWYREAIRIITVNNDPEFWWKTIFPDLNDFYRSYCIPEMITRRVQRGVMDPLCAFDPNAYPHE